MSCNKALLIGKGSAYAYLARLGTEPLVYKSISAKTSSTPLRLTVTGHGLPAHWSVAFTDIGYDDLNADEWPPEDSDDFFEATKIDTDTIEFNDIDLARLTGTFTNGSIAYQTPVDLAGASAVLNLYDTAGTMVLAITATLDNTAKTISATIDTSNVNLSVGDYTFALVFTDSLATVTIEDEGSLTIYPIGSRT
jgi:hypothetical protein